tara:strand:- start:39 stop:908 length:870 start_codon:yes stop_codon:yes gene_type:complete
MPYGYGSANRGSKGSAAPGGTGGGGWSPGAGRSKTGYLKTHPSHGGGGGNTPPKKKWTPGGGAPTHIPKKKTVTPPRFKDPQFLHNLKLKSIAARNRGITNTNNFRNMLSRGRDIPWSNFISKLLGFSHAGAAEPTDEELIERARKQKGKEKEIIGKIQGSDTTGPRPNVNDPFISSKIAEAAGLTTTPQRIGQKEVFGKKIPGTGDLLNMPTALSLDAIKQIQIDKHDNLMSLEDAQQKASDIGYPTVLTPEQTKTIYDMVRLQQPDQRTLVANGGLINLFKYGGFLG